MKLRKNQAHPDSNAIIKAEVKKLNYTCYSVTNAVIIPLHPTKGGPVSSKAPEWFQEWSDQIFAPFVREMKEFKTKQEAFNEKQEAFNEKQEVFNGEVRTFIDEQREFNKALLACPTIKKEIDPKFLDKYK